MKKGFKKGFLKCLKKIWIFLGVLILLVGFCKGWTYVYDHYINVKPFEKKVVLITGTASGIGKATAERLIKEGHIVYGGDIQYEKNKYLDEIGGHALDMDVTDVEQVQEGVEKVIAEQGKIDVLFNNAGYGQYGPIEEVSIEDAKAEFEVNIFGYANLVKAVLPYMRAQKEGLIINNTSVGGKVYFGWLGGRYHASKHALEGWTDVLRYEVKDFWINVVIIEPWFINTNFGNAVGEHMMKYIENTNYQHLFAGLQDQSADDENPWLVAMMSDPSVIAETVDEAMNAKKPKRRYARGAMSYEMITFRRIFGDAAFEWLLDRMF